MIKKADKNQPELFKQVRKLGFSIVSVHEVGKGCPDAIIGARGRNYLIEIKDPLKPPSARKLTPDELRFHSEWKGQVSVVETIDDVLKLIEK